MNSLIWLLGTVVRRARAHLDLVTLLSQLKSSLDVGGMGSGVLEEEWFSIDSKFF